MEELERAVFAVDESVVRLVMLGVDGVVGYLGEEDCDG